MQVLYSVNETKIHHQEPSEKAEVGSRNGKLHVSFDYIVGTAGQFIDGDLIKMMILPKGAKIVEVTAFCDALGGAGALDIGLYNYATGLPIDTDCLIDGLDAGAALAFKKMSNGGAGIVQDYFLEPLAVDSQVVVEWITTATLSTGAKLKVIVEYVLD